MIGCIGTSLRGMAKWFGAVQNAKSFNDTGVYTLSNYGGGMKIEAEAPFVAVRLFWISRVPNAMTGSKALVGVTESADTSVAAQAFHPRINGQTYNTVVTAPNILGWRLATWAGQPTVDHPAANSGAQVMGSDWVQCASVPRADGGLRPLLLIRGEHDGATGGAFATYNNVGITVLRTALNDARSRLLQLFTGTNMVSSVAAVNGAMGTVTYEIFPEFRYAVPATAVCGVGDSITQGEFINGILGIITTWGMRGCAEVSTPAHPVNWANCGAAGKQFPEFWARFVELVGAGYLPDVLVVTPFSVNDYSGDQGNMAFYVEQGKARAQQVFEYARDLGVKRVIFFPLLPWNSSQATTDQMRRGYNAWLLDFAASTGSGYMNLADLGDGATPERWATPYYNDGIHPNNVAIDTVMTSAFVKALLPAI